MICDLCVEYNISCTAEAILFKETPRQISHNSASYLHALCILTYKSLLHA